MALVDIVIPAYGRKDLLAEAIASVRAQSITDWQLWIVDDASPQALPESLTANDPRIRLLRLEQNKGPAFARNYGALLGNSPLIAFLDSDDLWQKNKLQVQLDFFAHHPNMQWMHTNELWLRNGKPVRQRAIHHKEGGQFFLRALARCLISPSAVMLRRGFFIRHGGFAPAFRWCEDYELWLRLLLAEPVGYTAEALTIKRAGAWPQLSSAKQIDRYRVLALHRIWRQMQSRIPEEWQAALLAECIRKTEILLTGARKHNNLRGIRRYQAWLTLFNTLRTRPMRRSSCAVSR